MREKSPSTVRVMTWNIHGAVGGNPRFDLAGVVELIKRWDADVIALQEVDSRRKPTRDNPFEFLRDACGRHGIGAKSITTTDGDYGQMLISQWPITVSEIHDISFPEREPRRAVKVEIETPLGSIRIIATHLGLSIGERRGQARSLLALTGARTMTTMVVGDFNDWFWPGSVRAALSRELPGYTRYRTFPSRWPLLRLDRVYCRPGEALIRSYIDGSARRCSDHLPIIADIAPHPAIASVPRRQDRRDEKVVMVDEVYRSITCGSESLCRPAGPTHVFPLSTPSFCINSRINGCW